MGCKWGSIERSGRPGWNDPTRSGTSSAFHAYMNNTGSDVCMQMAHVYVANKQGYLTFLQKTITFHKKFMVAFICYGVFFTCRIWCQKFKSTLFLAFTPSSRCSGSHLKHSSYLCKGISSACSPENRCAMCFYLSWICNRSDILNDL